MRQALDTPPLFDRQRFRTLKQTPLLPGLSWLHSSDDSRPPLFRRLPFRKREAMNHAGKIIAVESIAVRSRVARHDLHETSWGESSIKRHPLRERESSQASGLPFLHRGRPCRARWMVYSVSDQTACGARWCLMKSCMRRACSLFLLIKFVCRDKAYHNQQKDAPRNNQAQLFQFDWFVISIKPAWR